MIYLFALLAVVLRLLPHAPNFAPMGALALWAGMSGDKRKVWIPLLAVFFSDLFLGGYPGFVWVYASYFCIFFSGYLTKQTSGLARYLGAPIAGASIFYLVSNFGVWAGGSMYPATPGGLAQCYVAALPFFRNTLASDALYFNAFILLNKIFATLKNYQLALRFR